MTYNVHNLFRVAKRHSYDHDVERELIVETATGDPKEIHMGVWKDDGDNIGTFIALTPEEALEVGENLIARAQALLED